MKASKRFGFYGMMLWLCFLAACGRPDTSKTDTQDAQEASPTFTEEEKSTYLQQVRVQLNELGLRIDGLRGLAEGVAQAARDEMRAAVEGLSNQQQTLLKNADTLETATAQQWATLKAQLDADVADLERSYKEVRQFLQ